MEPPDSALQASDNHDGTRRHASMSQPDAVPYPEESMQAQVGSASVSGVESHGVSVEVNISVGLPSFIVVGLPHGAVREGRERVMAALANAGHAVPQRRITVNRAPADVPKEGSAFDLPIALAVLVGMGVVPQESVEGCCLVGELGLDALRKMRKQQHCESKISK